MTTLTLKDMMENWESDEPDEFVTILDQLNFKVVSKSPNDPGYFDDRALYPSENHLYLVECIRLKDEVKQWKENVKRCERKNRELEKKLGRSETEIVKLKGKIFKEKSAFVAAERKSKGALNALKIKHQCEIADKQKENRELQSRHSDELKKNSRIIKELQLEIAKKELLYNFVQQENDKVKNDLAEKSNDLKVVEGIMEEQQRTLETLEENRKSEVASLQNMIAEMQRNFSPRENERLHEEFASTKRENERLQESLASHESENKKLQIVLASEVSENKRLNENLALKGSEIERLQENLIELTFEKDVVINSWQRLSEAVKNCNSELEACINSFVKEYHVEIPVESVSPENEDEEGRLQSNLNVMALLVRKTVEEFYSSHEEEEGERRRDMHDQEPLCSSDCCDNNSGSYDEDLDHEAEEETGIADGSASRSSSSADQNDEGDSNEHEQPRQQYLPICSPISSESDESSSSETSSSSLNDDSPEDNI